MRKDGNMSSEFTKYDLNYMSKMAQKLARKSLAQKDADEFAQFAEKKMTAINAQLSHLNTELLDGNLDAHQHEVEYGLQQLIDHIETYQDVDYRKRIGVASQYLDAKHMLEHLQAKINKVVSN